MVQKLLADRFQLKFHEDKKELVCICADGGQERKQDDRWQH